MSSPIPAVGRRGRNKQQKLDRIVEAATALFAERGVDDVTTQEIADRADIGTGTLFLYARTKGELLLLVQNSSYEHALDRGIAQAEAASDRLDAVMEIIRAIVECNRIQIENGRTYLREIVFGNPEEPHHAAALAQTFRTEEAIIAVLLRGAEIAQDVAQARARTVSAVMFLSMAASVNVHLTVDEIVAEIRSQVSALV